MADVKITDLVDQSAIDKIKELDAELKKLLDDYQRIARDMAAGVNVSVNGLSDLEKLHELLTAKTGEANECTRKLNENIRQQGAVVANTTNTISRQLMEQERVNKAQRDAYEGTARVKALVEQVNGSYEQSVGKLIGLNKAIADNKKRQEELAKQLKAGMITQQQYDQALLAATIDERNYKQEKATLTTLLKNEEREANAVMGSYTQMSQQLELLKKAYKDMTDEEKASPLGKDMEREIQDLDAHLKDAAADMGEFQRNVGNYAIAGRDGVVSTESLVAAMAQEAVTAKDLADQTRILEEAKTMLNRSDAGYEDTLALLNAKLAENRARLADVSDIMGRQASSVAEAEAQNKRLKEALKLVDVNSDGARERIKQLNEKIASNTELIKQNTPALQENAKASGTLADQVLTLMGVNSGFGSSLTSLQTQGNVWEGLGTKCKAFGKTLTGLLANPWVLTFLGIAGVGAAAKWWYGYNKGLLEASRLTENFTGLTGEAADKVTADVQAIADRTGKGYDEAIGALNTLTQQFGLTWEEALRLMRDGIAAGADMSGSMLANIGRFAPALRDAGVSADEFMAILAETRNGIFDERGVDDILKGGTRLRAMTKQIADALDAAGISSQKMQKDLADGSITMLEAVQQVAARLKELPENSQEAGNIMRQVFGRTAAQGGMLLIQSIADVNTSLDVAKERMGKLGEVTEEQMAAQSELNETMAAVFKMSGTGFEEMTARAKTFLAQGATAVIKGCVEIVNWVVRMYNNSLLVRGAVNSTVNSFKVLWEVVKFVASQIIDSFKAVGKIIEGVMTLDWEKIQQGASEGMKAMGKNAAEMAKNIAGSTAKAVGNAMGGKLKEVSATLAGDSEVGAAPHVGGKASPNPITTVTATEAAKAAKEQLKTLQGIEAEKVGMMADGHEKEMAQIRLNFSKKLDAIKGDSEQEKQLRLSLTEQMQKELAKCEAEYQAEREEKDIDARLAAVEKGSNEELGLKLAKLDIQRKKEIKEAEGTGASVALIEAMYAKQREELFAENAEASVKAVEDGYAGRQTVMDAAYADEAAAESRRYREALAAAKGSAKDIERAEREHADRMAEINHRYARDVVANQVRMYEEILSSEELTADERIKMEADLAKAKKQLEEEVTAAAEEEAKKQAAADDELSRRRLQNIEEWVSVASDAFNNVTALASAIFDAKIQQVEEEQEANEEAGEAEQERISDLVEKNVITEEEGEARKRAAEAKTAKKNEELEKKKQKLQHKQAVWEKANNIAQVGMATALSLMRLWVTPGWPAAIPMMAVVSALGALQLATILATPIPKYAKGTDCHKGGLAVVGDGGRRELVLTAMGGWVTPDKPTLVDIPKGAQVLPEVPEAAMTGLAGLELPRLAALPPQPSAQTSVVVNNDYTELRREMQNVAYLIGQQTKEQRRAALRAEYERFKAARV